MDHRFCKCKVCRTKRKTEGKVLWHRLLRHFGSQAWYVSDYVIHPKFRKGKRTKRSANKIIQEINAQEN